MPRLVHIIASAVLLCVSLALPLYGMYATVRSHYDAWNRVGRILDAGGLDGEKLNAFCANEGITARFEFPGMTPTYYESAGETEQLTAWIMGRSTDDIFMVSILGGAVGVIASVWMLMLALRKDTKSGAGGVSDGLPAAAQGDRRN